jgi:hypothetical protein
MQTRDRESKAGWSRQPSERRDQTLTAIREHVAPVSLDELVETLTDGESTHQDTNADPAADPRTVRLHLHHVDLPRLHHLGVIEYDHAHNIVKEL